MESPNSLNIVFNPTIYFNDAEWTPAITRLMVAKDGNVQEALFIKLEKWDAKLVQICTGKCLRFGKGTSEKTSSINVKFFDDIVDLVHTEISVSTMRAQSADDDDGGAHRGRKRKISRRHLTPLTPKTVNITMPAVGNLPERVATFKTELKCALWMELTDANLLHFITGIQQCKIAGRKRRAKDQGDEQEQGDSQPWPEEEWEAEPWTEEQSWEAENWQGAQEPGDAQWSQDEAEPCLPHEASDKQLHE